jgi:serine/threonine protein kinase
MSYSPIEILLGHRSYGIGIDIWALGCIFAELFIKDVLFYENTEIQLLFNIFQKVGTPNFESWSEVQYFKPNSIKFPQFTKSGFQYIKNIHPEFDDVALDLLEQMLNPNPHLRPNCKVIKNHLFFKDLKTNSTL